MLIVMLTAVILTAGYEAFDPVPGQSYEEEEDCRSSACPDVKCAVKCGDVKCQQCPTIRCPDVHCSDTKDKPQDCTSLPSNSASDMLSPASDCHEIRERGHMHSGVYTVSPSGTTFWKLTGYCDMDEDGSWLVIQRRQDGSVNFTRTYDEYRKGFGSLAGEFWLGSDVLYDLTRQQDYILRVELKDLNDADTYAEYSTFKVASAANKFRLTVEGFSGTASDAMAVHNNQQFSAPDQDNDSSPEYNCAEQRKSGWWFNNCDSANLNGVYTTTQHGQSAGNEAPWYYLYWGVSKKFDMNLKSVVMKIRPRP